MVTRLAVLGLYCSVRSSPWSGRWDRAHQRLVSSMQPDGHESRLPPMGTRSHVLAPHVVDGKQVGPYHHYCKVLAPTR